MTGEGSARLAQASTQAQIDAVWSTYATQHTYDAAGRRASSTDARGNTTVFYYDATGRLAYRILKTPQGGEVQASRYTAFSETAQTTRYSRRLSLADTAALTGGRADATLDGKIAALADDSDQRTQALYNQRGLIQQAIDALGFKTDYSYNAFGQLSRSEAAAGSLGSLGDGRVLRTDYAYDRRGLQTRSTQDAPGLNVQTQAEYDAFGRQTASVDARGYRSTTRYLASDGNPDSGRQVIVTDATGASRSTTYDAFDRVVRQTDALGQSITFSHDAANRRMTMTSALGIQTVTQYSRHGQVVQVTDGTGAVTRYDYDRNGNLLSTTDALGNVTSNTYDRGDNRVTLTGAGNTGTTRYEYDAANRLLVQTVDPDGLKLSTRYEYDGHGRAVTITDAAGTVTRHAFNGRGELREVTVDDQLGGLQLKTRYAYDAQGRVLSVTEGAGTGAAKTTEYRYDLLGRRTQEVVDPAGLKLTTAYEFDAAGNVVRKTDAVGAVARYAYDAAGRQRFTIDAEGYLSEQRYDAAGRVTSTLRYDRRFKLGAAPTEAELVAATQSITTQFTTDLEGFSGSAGVWEAGRLKLISQPLPGGAWAGINSSRAFAAGSSFKFDLTPVDLQQSLHAGVSAVGSPFARLTALFGADGHILAQIYDASTGNWGYTDLGTYTPGTTYTVEIVTTQTGGMLYVYPKGAARTGGYTYSTKPDDSWTQVHLFFATQTYPSVPGTTTAYVDNIEERSANAQVTRYVYDAAGRQRFTIDAEGYLSEQRYDAAGRVTSTLRYDRRFKLGAAPTEAELVAATQSITTQFTTDLEGFSGSAGVWEAGRLKLISQPLPGGAWAGINSSRAFAAGSSFKFDLTPVDLQQSLHAGVSAVGSPFARLTALFGADGHILAQIYDASTGNWGYTDLGTYTPGTTYTVEIVTTQTGGMLYVYPKGAARTGGYTYSTKPDDSWTQVHLFFATQTYPSVPGTTTAYVDNIEERSANAQVTRYVYDAAGRQRFTIDAEGYLSEQRYDAAGRVTSTLRYDRRFKLGAAPTEAELVAATQSITTQFTTDLEGFSGSAGVWEAGRLKLISQPLPGGAWAGINSSRAFAAGSSFKFDLTPVDLQQSLHAGVSAVGSPFARLTALFGADGHILAQIYDASTGNWGYTDLGTYTPGTTYTVEIVTTQTGGMLYVYPKGAARTGGYTYSTKPDDSWTQVHLFFATQTYPSVPGTTTAYVDNIEERSANAQVTRYVYDAAGRQRFTIDAEGYLSEQRYDAAGRVTSTLRYDRRFKLSATPTEAELISATRSLSTQFTSSLEGFEGSAGVWDSGRLKLISQPLPDGNWAGMNSNLTLAAGASFKFELTPNDLQQALHAGVVASGGPYARLVALFGSDGHVRAQTYDATIGTWAYQDLGTYSAGITYTVEITTTDTGGTLTVYPKNASRAAAYSYTYVTAPDAGWQNVHLFFATQTYPSVPSTTTAYVDNIEERSARAQATRYVYDAAGRQRFTIDAEGYLSEQRYDAAGRVTSTLRYDRRFKLSATPTEAELISATRSLSTQFTSSLEGFEGSAGVWDSGRLKLISQPLPDGNWAGMNSNLTLAAGASFKFELTPNDLQQALHAGVVASGGPYARLVALFGSDGHVRAQTYDATIGTWAYQDLGTYSAGITYTVEITTTDTGGMLTVYPKNASRAAAYSYTYVTAPDAGWQNVHLFFATQTYPSVPSTTTAYVDNIEERSARAQATRYVYDAAGRQRFTIDAEGYLSEQRYDAAGRVTSTLRYDRRFKLSATPTEAELISATRSLSTQFTSSLEGFEGSAGVWDSGRLKLISQPLPDGNWAGMNSNLTLAAGASFKFELTPNDLQQALHAGVVASGGPYARLVALFGSDGHVRAQTYDATIGTWAYQDLGTYSAGITYTVEITTTDTGGTLTIYPKNASRAAAYSYTYVTAPDAGWQKVRLFFATQTYPSVPSTTTAYVDNIEERSAGVQTTRYVYDATKHPLYQQDPLGYITKTRYNATGQVIEQTRYATPLPTTTPATQAAFDAALAPDPTHDRPTRYVYDQAGQLRFTIDALGGVTESVYNAHGQVVRTIAYDTPITYTAVSDTSTPESVRALLPTSTLAARETLTTYDATGRVLHTAQAQTSTATTKLFTVTENQYDAFGRLTRSVAYSTPVALQDLPAIPNAQQLADKLTPLANPAADRSTRYTYDAAGRLVQSTDAEGYTEQYTYDAFGHRSTYRNKAGGLFSYQYDARGLLLAETLPITTRTTTGTQIPVVNRHVYDAFGNRIQTIEAQGAPEQRSTRFEYDALGRLRVTRGDAVTVYTAAAGGTGSFTANVTPTTTVVYDSAGNVIEQTDPNGNRTRSWYDALNRKIAEVNAAGILSTWQRDGAGNVTVQRVYADPVLVPAAAANSPPTPAATNTPRETRFSYDALGRQTEARVTGLDLRRYQEAADGSLIETSSSVARVAQVYDAAGNLVKGIDGNGGITLSFYDLGNHKILEIDAEGYAIAWTRGADGALLRETRFARRHPSPASLTEASAPAALLAAWPTDAADRITEFSYDHLGRLLTETRLNVAYGRVDATTGALSEAVGGATRRYAYDSMDHKIRETDANGAQTDWLYDATGRLLRQQGAAATDFEGAVVRATTEYEYDGLNNATRVIRRGKDGNNDNTTEADDQILRFSYGAGGRLLTQTDALGHVTTLAQDAAGNLTLRRYTRADADGVAATEAVAYCHDALNREVMRQNLWQPGTQPGGVPATGAWQAGDTFETRYNAWGEVTGRRTNGGNAAGDWQELAEYNALGLVQKTNFGSDAGGGGQAGITKVFVYDANGNATVSLQSTGADLQPLSLAQVLASSASYRTLTLYDRRNQVVSVRQPRMDGAHDVLDVRQLVTQQVQDFAGGSAQVNNAGAVLSTQPAGATPPPVLTDAQRFQTMSTSVSWTPIADPYGESGYEYTHMTLNSVAVNFSAQAVGQSLGAWNSVKVRVDYRLSGSTVASGSREVTVYDRTAQSTVVNLGLNADVANVNFSYTVTVTYQYLGTTPAVNVATGQATSRLAWLSTEQVSDGEGGYRAVVHNNFAAASAANTSFKTADLGALASVAPGTGFNVWQDKVGADTLSATVDWNPLYDGESGYAGVAVNSVTVTVPAASLMETFGALGEATVFVDYALGNGPLQTTSKAFTRSDATYRITLPLGISTGLGAVNFRYNVRVAYAVNGTSTRSVLVANATELNTPIGWTTTTLEYRGEDGYVAITTQYYAEAGAFNRSFSAATANKTWFTGDSQLLKATKAYFYYRTSTTGPYTGIEMERGSVAFAKATDPTTTPAAGAFYVWNSWLPARIVDYKIVAMNGPLFTGSFSGTSAGASTRLTSDTRAQVGQVFFDNHSALHFLDQGTEQTNSKDQLEVTTPRLAVQYRRTGSSEAWATAEVSNYPVDPPQKSGWFSWPWQAAGLSGAYDLRILRMDAAGAVKARLFTQVNLTATPSATALVPYAESDLVLANQPTTAASLTFRYRPVGSTGGWTSTGFTKRGEGLFGRDFQNDNLLPGVITATSQYDYEYQYEALDAAGQVVNGATGTFRITPNAKQFLSHTGTRAPTVVSFVIEPQNALKMALRYRALDRNGVPVGDYSTVSLTRTSNKEPFRWNASTLTPTSGSASYEYEYRLLDGAGNAVLNPVGEAIVVQGTATIGQVTQQVPQTTWVTTGSVSTANTIVRRQARNAFGEVQSETDGRGNTTTLAYNTLGQLVLKQDPLTDVTGENGVTTRATPQTRYVYDLAGRAVGTRDANGYWSTQVWQEGQAQPQIAREFHADGGRLERAYDVFGNLRSSTDAEGRQTRYRYDQNDQLTRVDRPARTAGQYLAGQAAWETYEYDSLGQRIAATTVLGRSRQYFDLQGRVSRTTSIEGRSTRYAYTWDNTITGAGGRQVGGWLKTTTLSGGLTARDKSDVFGRMTWRQDYGNHVFSYGYNLAGWLMTQTSTLASAQGVQAQQNLGYEYYANGYVKKQTDFVTKLQSSYAYDDNGNRVFEEARRSDDANAVYYSSSTTYDELNRVKQVKDQQYTITTRYDAAGNRRNVNSYYQDGVDGSQATQDLWYLYDPMNRFTVTMGQLKDGLITRGTTGKLIGYNKAGERMVAEYTADDGKTQYSERYTYTSDGYLQDMFRSIKAAGSSSFTAQTTPAATRQTDLAGRVLNYTERNADNSIRSNLNREYDRDNRQLKEYDYTLLKDGKPRTDAYGYNADGTLAQIVTTNTSDGTSLTRRYSYEWWDSAQQKSITLQAQNEAAPGWDKGTSLFTYDVNGHLVRATDVQGKRTIQYVSDADGQILYRQEVAARNGVASDWHWFSDSDHGLGGEAVAGDVARKRHYYYLSGHRVGDVNNEGPQPNGVDYAEALAQSKTAEPTKFAPTAYANFDANYQAINESYPGRTGTDYTVQKGDTLQGIAERLWGDRSLWYLIAEANGLVGAESLTEGMRLTIPNKVTNVHNNSGTVGVYDAGAAIGDTSPTLPAPPPPPKQGCGTLGTIIMIAVAVVVTAYLGPIAGQAFGSALGGAVTAAAASVASQGVGMAIGQQTEFSWKAVGQAALAGGIGGGLGASGLDVGGSAFGAGTWQGRGRQCGHGHRDQPSAAWRLELAQRDGLGGQRRAGR